jgi:predicted phosphodiesterase
MVSSDLHSHTFRTLEKLRKTTNIDLSQWDIITLGDMAGDGFFGSDGDPTAFYAELQKEAKSLLVVQGNHDLPPDPKGIAFKHFDKRSLMANGEVRDTVHGFIGGVNGIMSGKPHPYKIPRREYMKYLKGLKRSGKLDFVATHDAPRYFHGDRECVGDDEIYEVITKVLRPKVFMYGHCHHPCHTIHNGVHFLNADARLILINPPDDLNLDIESDSESTPTSSKVENKSDNKPAIYIPVGMTEPTSIITVSAKRRIRKKKAQQKLIT